MKTFVPALVAISSVAVIVAANGNTTAANEALAVTLPHQVESNVICRQPDAPFPFQWYYNTKDQGPYTCTNAHESHPWSMMNAYRSGGTEGAHWKYTDINDDDCLYNWTYWSSDGQTLIATIKGGVTTINDSRRWCALAVYRTGGIRGKQWEYCYCRPEAARE